MWPLGFMLWRIGDMLDIDQQIDWITEAGFTAISFHAHPGVPGRWRGVDPAATGTAERHRLRERLAHFAMREIHAPFKPELTPDKPSETIAALEPVLSLAEDLGAELITVHGATPTLDQDGGPWYAALDHLEALADTRGVRIGLELMTGFEALDHPRRPHIGVTLDIGHMYHGGGAGYRLYGSIGDLVRSLGDLTIHIHAHDHDGRDDHIELGAGLIDYDDLMRAVVDIGYAGAFCLELNPDRVGLQGIGRSRRWLQAIMRQHASGPHPRKRGER